MGLRGQEKYLLLATRAFTEMKLIMHISVAGAS
jgi:hypothetical protein